MWKASMTEGGSEALMASLGAEAASGQVELMVAEMALFGVIMGVKKIKEHHTNKKNAKQAEDQRKADEAEKARKDAEDAENARLEEIARQQEQARIDAENAAELARQQHQEMEEAKIENAVVNVQSGLAMGEYEREERIQELEIEHGLDNQDNGWQMPPPQRPVQMQPYNNVPRGYGMDWMNYVPRDQIAGYDQIMAQRNIPIPPDPNGGGGGNGGGGNGGNGGGGNGGGGNGGGGGNNPNPNPNPNNGGQYGGYSTNPYYDLISQIASQIQRQKNQEADKREAENKDKEVPVDPLDPANKTDADEILDNQHLMQQELEAALGALGEQQLTEEEMLVQLESIEKMIDDQIPDQVKMDPYSVFSSDIVSF